MSRYCEAAHAVVRDLMVGDNDRRIAEVAEPAEFARLLELARDLCMPMIGHDIVNEGRVELLPGDRLRLIEA